MLAQTHRPHRLADVVGQRHATAVLKRALQAGKLPQQLLFSGGSGLGKTTLARCVAAALLCDAPHDGDACGMCESCLDISTPGRIHPDVVEFDAASNGQKEQIKELASRAQMAPQRGSHRVYIIDEAHGLSLGGGQAFLKLLEEPPSHVVFMLATTDPEKMLRTNRGRCVEFELARPSDEELAEHLVKVASSEGWELSTAAADAVVAATDPALGLRGLLMTLEKLSDTLSWGGEVDEDEVASLLGLPPTTAVRKLVTLIDDHDRVAALAEVSRLRSSVSDEALRRALVAVLRGRVLAAARPVDVWRYEQAVSAPSGRLHTEVLVCRLAAPELDPTATALAAHADEASRRLAELAQSLAKTPRPTDPAPARPAVSRPSEPAASAPRTVAPAVKPAARPATPERRPASEKPVEKPVEKPTAAKESPAPAKKAKADVTAKSATSTTALDRLLAELGKDAKAKPAIAALRASAPETNGDRITLSPPSDALKKRLEQSRDVLKSAADRVGVKLTIKK